MCENTHGSFSCRCPTGYQLSRDGSMCSGKTTTDGRCCLYSNHYSGVLEITHYFTGTCKSFVINIIFLSMYIVFCLLYT